MTRKFFLAFMTCAILVLSTSCQPKPTNIIIPSPTPTGTSTPPPTMTPTVTKTPSPTPTPTLVPPLPELVNYACFIENIDVKVSVTVDFFSAIEILGDIPPDSWGRLINIFGYTGDVFNNSSYYLPFSHCLPVEGSPSQVYCTGWWYSYLTVYPLNIRMELLYPGTSNYYVQSETRNIWFEDCRPQPKLVGYGCADENTVFVTIDTPGMFAPLTGSRAENTFIMGDAEFNCFDVPNTVQRVYCTAQWYDIYPNPMALHIVYNYFSLTTGNHVETTQTVYFPECIPTPTSSPPPSRCAQYDSPGMCLASGCVWNDATWSCREP